MRAIRVLVAHRTAEPVPVFWLGAAAVGVLLGALLEVIAGWPWLLVAALWLGLVWLVFLATALRPSGRDGLWIDLVRTVWPTRAKLLEVKQLIRLAQAAPGPVYGLSDWRGRRSLGGYGRSSKRLAELTLMYGNDRPHRSGGPYLEVSTRWDTPSYPDSAPDQYREPLTRQLWHRQTSPPEDLTPGEFHDWVIRTRAEIERRLVPEWVQTELLVDGCPHVADTFSEGDDWVAIVELDTCLVWLHSHRVPAEGVVLNQIQDLQPYFEHKIGTH